MPLIQLTVPTGTLTNAGRATVQQTLADVLLKWEGAQDNEFFRVQVWSYLHEIAGGAQVTAGDDEPRFRVDVTCLPALSTSVAGPAWSRRWPRWFFRYADLVALANPTGIADSADVS
jgi:hypothetical protein